MKKTKSILFIIFFLVALVSVKAQKPDSLLAVYSEHYPQEKVHIQFDKSFYNAGDIIWYKAYLLAGTEPSDNSANFYVDWFGDDGRLLQHTIDPLEESGAKGQFQIPSGYKGRLIYLKAYTKWMLNFDAELIFQKSIPVLQKTTLFKKDDNNPTKIRFFPEGGDMITGVVGRIAFKANDAHGMPVTVKGIVKNGTGAVVDSFISEHDGMGSIMLEPAINEIYTAIWTDEFSNTPYTTPLPMAKGNGVVLEVRPLAERDIITVKRSNMASEEMKTLHLIAHMNQHPVYSASINLHTKNTIISEIPTASLPTGILQITLFNASWVPVAERIVFVNNHEYSFPTKINTLVKGLGKREKNVFEITLADNAAANLSVAVTDAELTTDDKFANNIFTQLLLCADLKGAIYQPAYYFSGDDDSIDNHLDLVMLTHGWRRFNWEEIIKGKLSELPYTKDTGSLMLDGQVKNISKFKLPKEGQQITMLLQDKDSGQQVLSGLLQANGNFSQPMNPFYDSAKLYYQFVNHQQLTDKADISFKTNWAARPADYPDSTAKKWFAASITAAVLNKSLFFLTEDDRIEKDKQAHRLADVIVKTKIKKQEELLDEQYTSGLYRGGDAIKLDVTADPKYFPGMAFADYIVNKAPGLRVLHDSIGNLTLSWRGDQTDVYLDEMYMSQDSTGTGIKNINMSDIGYIKIFKPGSPTGMSNSKHLGGSPGGAIALYSKTGDHRDNNLTLFKLVKLEGYTPYKEFYSPDYTEPAKDFFKDARTTLYWSPVILSKVSGNKIKVAFYNNDYSKKFRVLLEGIDSEGRLTRAEKIIE